MKKHKIIVESCPDEMRVDRYLREFITNLKQSAIEKAARRGDLKLNNIKIKPSARVKTGDVIIFYGPDATEFESQEFYSHDVTILAKKILTEYLIAENDYFLVINKPSGIASQGGTKVELCIDDALKFLNKELSKEELIEKGYRLVHRLDKATSGVFIIAKDRASATKISTSFEEKEIEKTYLAILCGVPNKMNGKIINHLTKDRERKMQIVSDLGDGDYAETDYTVLAVNGKYSLVQFKPKTGRMHQIRVHANFLGCPILGDDKYGGEKIKGKLMLHAASIILDKKIFGHNYAFFAEPPEFFQKFLEKNSLNKKKSY